MLLSPGFATMANEWRVASWWTGHQATIALISAVLPSPSGTGRLLGRAANATEEAHATGLDTVG